MTLDPRFDQPVSRSHTHSLKYDQRLQQFGCAEVIPLWVADMDFACPQAVSAALIARAQHPIYGYSVFPDELYTVLINWLQQQHAWSITRDSILMCPGVVPCLSAAVLAFTQPGDAVIVQPPVYAPFFDCVTQHKRRVLENPLRFEHGHYQINFDHLEACAAQGAKLLLLCSPHNPVGRVWQEAELLKILHIARRYQLVILADEIHADLIYPEHVHTPLARLANAEDRILTAVAPSKTFNIPGLGLSSLIVPHSSTRHAIQQVLASWHISTRNPLSLAGFIAAYQQGAEWKQALMAYLNNTQHWVIHYCTEHMPKIKPVQAQGTYLLWLDCLALKLNDAELADFFVRQANVGLSPGVGFGNGGSGYMRMNLAAPLSLIQQAVRQIHQAYLSAFL